MRAGSLFRYYAYMNRQQNVLHDRSLGLLGGIDGVQYRTDIGAKAPI